jgi:hypothetical protein
MATTAVARHHVPTHRALAAAPAIRGHRAKIAASAAAGVLAVTSVVGTASAHSTEATGNHIAATHHSAATVNTGKIYFGVDGTVSHAAEGQNVARHRYGQLAGSVPDARMVTMSINGYTYASVAAAAPGSEIYNNVVRWADTIRDRGTLTFFGFIKEPEAANMARFGSVSDYLAAYRHVVDIFRSEDLPNVRYVWQMTAYSFVSKGPNAASNYYPGDAYVDDVGEDPYNWDGCGPGGPWRDLGTAASPALEFAQAHDKLAIVAEFASQSDPRRPLWLAAAQQWLIANRSEIQAAFYFDRPPTTAAGSNCSWTLTNPDDIDAFRAIVADTTDFTS